jgi:hypothetical protein
VDIAALRSASITHPRNLTKSFQFSCSTALFFFDLFAETPAIGDFAEIFTFAKNNNTTAIISYRSRAWYDGIISEVYADVNVNSDNDFNKIYLNIYVDKWIKLTTEKLYSKIILKTYQNYFENWTKETFNMVHAKLRNVFKTYLKIKSIYIFVGARGRVLQ